MAIGLTPEQKAQVRETALAVFRESVRLFKESGAVLSETDGGWVRAEFVYGTDTIPVLRFPKASLADKKWRDGTLRNLAYPIMKAQISAEIRDAVANEPL